MGEGAAFRLLPVRGSFIRTVRPGRKGGGMSDSKVERGTKIIERLFGGATRESPLASEFRRMTVEHLFGDVWQGPGLSIEERSLLTCTVLVALGREAEQRLHFQGARNLGIPRGKMEAMITHVAHYAGWPVAVSAFHVLQEVWPAAEGQTKSP